MKKLQEKKTENKAITVKEIETPKVLVDLKTLFDLSKSKWEDQFKAFQEKPDQDNLNILIKAIGNEKIEHVSNMINRYVKDNGIFSDCTNACQLQYNGTWKIKTCERLLISGDHKCNSKQLSICKLFCKGGELKHSRKKFGTYKIALSVM